MLIVSAPVPLTEGPARGEVPAALGLARTGLRHPNTVARLGADSYGFVADWLDRLADELEREAG